MVVFCKILKHVFNLCVLMDSEMDIRHAWMGKL